MLHSAWVGVSETDVDIVTFKCFRRRSGEKKHMVLAVLTFKKAAAFRKWGLRAVGLNSNSSTKEILGVMPSSTCFVWRSS